MLQNLETEGYLNTLNEREVNTLAGEIRAFLIENVAKTGGHLSSNLGTIELTLAMHRVFNFKPGEDVVIFDVGHQCYTHKILTGRIAGFEKLRKLGGVSGFPDPTESETDFFNTGHGSTSISAAVGFARAKKISNESGYVVAVIGDGAFTGGLVYEGMNNIDKQLDNLIVILNDNKMSISKNVGSISRYFTTLRSSESYFGLKRFVERALAKTPLIGKPISLGIVKFKSMLRRLVYKSTFFEDMGFTYIGPVYGHNTANIVNILSNAKHIQGPVLLHVETTKGKGYKPAEDNPGEYHGVSSFDPSQEFEPDYTPENSFSNVFGRVLCDEAEKNESICAITAAMKYGTGLHYFYKQHKARFFDVGMAEQHAVIFGAGLAKSGLLPVFAVYSTFLQRSYDQVLHDVVLQNLNFMLAIDRAGIIPGDGATHQGIYDTAILGQFSNFFLFAPANYAELRYWTAKLLNEYTTPRAIRYPRGEEDEALKNLPCTGEKFDCVLKCDAAKIAIVTYGRQTAQCLKAAQLLGQDGICADVYKLNRILPLPEGILAQLLQYKTVLFAEDNIMYNGIGQKLELMLKNSGFDGQFMLKAVTNHNVEHAAVIEIQQTFGLDANSLYNTLKQ